MKIMSIIGILLSAIGLFFALATMAGGYSQNNMEMAGFGVINMPLFGFFLALSIVGVCQKKPPVVLPTA